MRARVQTDVTDASQRACALAVEQHEPRFARAAEQVLRQYVRDAVRGFEHAQLVVHASAAEDEFEPPRFHLPVTSELIDHAAANADLEHVTRTYREKVTRTTGNEIASSLGIVFDQRNRLIDGVIAAQSGMKIVTAPDDVAREMMTSLQHSYDTGASVQRAARDMRSAGYQGSKSMAERIARTETVGASNGASLAMVMGGTNLTVKIWIATADERTREAHAEADGQEVPIDQPFDVDGEELMHPGDPDGSAENVVNCRCTLGYGEGDATTAGGMSMATTTGRMARSKHDHTPFAADAPAPEDIAAGGAKWSGVIAQEGVDTGDGRRIEAGALTWRPLPLTLMGQKTTPEFGGHTDAAVCGRIDEITRNGENIVANGVFDTGAWGADIERMVRDGMLKGVSVDLAVNEAEIEEDPDIEDPMESYFMGTLVVKDGTILGATVVPFPAFENASIAIVAGAAMTLRNARRGDDGTMIVSFYMPFAPDVAPPDAPPADAAPADTSDPDQGEDDAVDAAMSAVEDASGALDDALAALRKALDADASADKKEGE